MADQAEKRAKSVAEQVRERVLAAIAAQDAALATAYNDMAEGVRRDLRASGFSIDAVRRVIEKHFKATLPARQRIIENAIVAAAREARVLPQATFDAVYGEEAASEAAAPFDRASRPAKTPLRPLRRASEDEPR